MNRSDLAQYMPVVDGYPRPRWEGIRQLIANPVGATPHEQWCLAARTWLELTAEQLGAPYRVTETPKFLLLTPFNERRVELLSVFVEKTLRRILRMLEGLAEVEVLGKRVIMVFETQEAYYRYAADFYRDGEHPTSGGLFLDTEYGHIALPFRDLAEAEATVAHELTHNCLRCLPLPLWLDEGLAVTIEHELCNNHPLRMTTDRLREHKTFWTAQTIQEFWRGTSFARLDEGRSLSYELARYCVRSLAHDMPSFVEFALHASYKDGGEASALQVYQGGLGGLIEQFFGPGDWSPAFRRKVEASIDSERREGG